MIQHKDTTRRSKGMTENDISRDFINDFINSYLHKDEH